MQSQSSTLFSVDFHRRELGQTRCYVGDVWEYDGIVLRELDIVQEGAGHIIAHNNAYWVL